MQKSTAIRYLTTFKHTMRCSKLPPRNSRRSITSYDLHTRMRRCSGANKLLLMSGGGEQCCGSFTQSLKTLHSDTTADQTVVSTCRRSDVLQSCCARFLTGRFTSLHPVQFPSSRRHTCDCRGSLSQLHTLERESRLEHFSGVLSFFI